MPTSSLRINAPRLLANLECLSRIGKLPDGGICRLALSDEDKLARDQLVTWMDESGLDIRIDQVGNIFGVRAGLSNLSPVMLGSHIDSVIGAGDFDGCYGVLAALEVINILNENGIVTKNPIAVASFSNEEGVRYQPGMLGSSVYSGALDISNALNIVGVDGSIYGGELERIGYAGKMRSGDIRPGVYVELHVEQGPLLDRERIPIGVVDGVVGISWWEVTVSGGANHAGTTPVEMRRDAGLAAAKLVQKTREIALKVGGDQRSTCGMIRFFPNAINVIPGKVILTVDLRNSGEAGLAAAEDLLLTSSREIEASDDVSIAIKLLEKVPAVKFDKDVVSSLEKISGALGIRSRRMISGAGHDAQLMARICPTAMIFIPSKGGVSHSPEEFSSPEALTDGGNVLLHSLLVFAGVVDGDQRF
jgi:beta-ureidopropionase / N-carbamoyl-L-amino-acid hydrolase